MIYAFAGGIYRLRRETDEFLSRGPRIIRSAVPFSLLGIQVWRPLPPINEASGTGCYSLVGNQGISSITIPEGGGFTLRPSSRCDIPFQPGDVLGFYVDIPFNHINNVVVIERALGDNTVWYTENRQLTPRMPSVYLVGDNPPGDLHRSSSVAPAISIAIVTYPCPTSLSTLNVMTICTPLPNPTTFQKENYAHLSRNNDPGVLSSLNLKQAELSNPSISKYVDYPYVYNSMGIGELTQAAPAISISTVQYPYPEPGPKDTSSSNTGLIAGIVAVSVVILCAVVVVTIMVLLSRSTLTATTTANQAYGVAF